MIGNASTPNNANTTDTLSGSTAGLNSGRLYIIRHGRTDWNDQQRLQGQTDIPLNEEGRRMAEAAAKEYAGIPFDVCFCSPLERASETAQILLKGRNVPIRYDDRLKEVSFGVYEGMANSFQIPNCPVNQFFFHPEEYLSAVEGGESVLELKARTGEFLRERAYPLVESGKSVLIVGHGAMNMSIVCNVKNLPLAEFWSTGIENCRLVRLI